MAGYEALDIVAFLLWMAFTVILTLAPLWVWNHFQNASQPGWQLIPIYVLVAFHPPVGEIAVVIYCLFIIKTHFVRTKRDVATEEQGSAAH